MYIPNHYKWKDNEAILSFIERFNFGLIISADNDKPSATHLPFVVEKRGNSIYIISHFARANPQWKAIENKEILVVFNEPHSYISPSFYSKKQNVPTWNYLSVHVYGKAKILEEEQDVFKVLETSIHSFEPSYKKQWEEISVDYKQKMVKGIVAFEIEVTEIQAKEKLSQNKTKEEQERIIANFSNSEDENQKLIAQFMQKKN